MSRAPVKSSCPEQHHKVKVKVWEPILWPTLEATLRRRQKWNQNSTYFSSIDVVLEEDAIRTAKLVDSHCSTDEEKESSSEEESEEDSDSEDSGEQSDDEQSEGNVDSGLESKVASPKNGAGAGKRPPVTGAKSANKKKGKPHARQHHK